MFYLLICLNDPLLHEVKGYISGSTFRYSDPLMLNEWPTLQVQLRDKDKPFIRDPGGCLLISQVNERIKSIEHCSPVIGIHVMMTCSSVLFCHVHFLKVECI